MLSNVYHEKYSNNASHIGFLVKALSENAGSTVNSAANNGGADGVQALLDAVMDAGYREVLVSALASPAISGWVRDKLEVFLYGQRRQLPALLLRRLH